MSIADKLTTIAENTQKVHEAGKKAEHDAFWDSYQHKGARTNYPAYSFYGEGFDFDNFYPKYDIKPNGTCLYLFYAWEKSGRNIKGSLKQRLEECGVVLDTSNVTNFSHAFNYSRFNEIPTINCLNFGANTSSLFSNDWGALITIEKLIVNEAVTYKSWFVNSNNLTNITFEGTIGQSIDFQYSKKLSKASIDNIAIALSTTASGMTLTLSKDAVNAAYETSEGAKDGSTSAAWSAIVNSRTNWTISLI